MFFVFRSFLLPGYQEVLYLQMKMIKKIELLAMPMHQQMRHHVTEAAHPEQFTLQMKLQKITLCALLRDTSKLNHFLDKPRIYESS